MLTSPNEIGGIDASSEKRMRLAIQSRYWRAGSIDHARMVKSDLFCEKKDSDCCIDDDNREHDFTKILKGVANDGERSLDEESRRSNSIERTIDTSRMQDASKPQTKTLCQKIVVLSLKSVIELMKRPLRFGIAVLLFYHYFIRSLK